MKSVTITPSALGGSVTVPPSKSLSHRAVICASLAGGISEIRNIGVSEDIIEASLTALIDSIEYKLSKGDVTQ